MPLEAGNALDLAHHRRLQFGQLMPAVFPQPLCAASRVSGTVVVMVADAGSAIAHRKACVVHACGRPANASRNARATACRSAISLPAIAPAASGTVLTYSICNAPGERTR